MDTTDTANQLPRFDVIGVSVHAVQIPEAIRWIEQCIAERAGCRYVTLTNVQGVVEAQRNQAVDEVFKCASLVCPDGMPLIWIARRRGFPLARRVYGPDLLWDFCSTTQAKGYRHFFYGGAPDVCERIAKRLKRDFPGMTIAGFYSPPFRPLRPEEQAEIVKRIEEARPDILWVGLGCPKQELWMHEFSRVLNVPVMLGVGQAFDIYAGNLHQAPPWMREHGLEWLFRLCCEPRRLWKRYLIYNGWFVAALVRRAASTILSIGSQSG